ncbi:mCG1036215 [Mus musculus]|nr:mCG1036215 [Mus musculus]
MNFKHEVSVPYAMNLLNGIKLFRRPIKIQFRSGCSHASQDASMSYPQHRVGNLSPTSTSPKSYERTVGNVTLTAQMVQRSFSSPEAYQRQAMVDKQCFQTDVIHWEIWYSTCRSVAIFTISSTTWSYL